MTVDDNILKGCQKGKRKAQHDLYRLCFSYLMSISLRYFKNEIDARSAVNEAFLKIVNNISKYEQGRPFKPWIKRIAINTIIDNHRKSRKADIVELNEQLLPDDFQTVDIQDEPKAMNFKQIQDMIAQLPPMSQQVMNLYALDGYRHQEIAEILGISESTSKWHLFNARKKLKIILEASDANIKSNIYG